MNITVEKIKSIFKAEVDPSVEIGDLKADQDFAEFGVDSLDRSSVFMAIEDEFEISISDLEIEELKTINDIIAFVKRKA